MSLECPLLAYFNKYLADACTATPRELWWRWLWYVLGTISHTLAPHSGALIMTKFLPR